MSKQTLTCTPPPELLRVASFISYRCLVFPQKMSSKEELMPECFGVIHVKIPKKRFYQHIHSDPILINLTFLDNNEGPIIRKISIRRKRCKINISTYINVM